MNLFRKKGDGAPRISDRARDKRAESKGTVYDQLLARGFTPEQMQSASDRSDALSKRKFGVVLMDSGIADAEPLVGIVYTGDYRAKEEYGIPELSKALMSERSAEIAVIDKGVYRFDVDWRGESPSIYGVTNAIKDAQERVERGGTDVGEFHSGQTLVLIPNKDDALTKAALDILFRDSGPAGALRMGGGPSNPFFRSAVLHDERDIPVATMNRIRADEEFHRRAMEAVKGVREELNKHGYVGFLGNPRPPREDEVGTRYWLRYTPQGSKQICRSFTFPELMQLAADKGVSK